MKGFSAIILAAGMGKRMKSKLVKVLHQIAGRPMLLYPVEQALKLKPDRVVVVVGHQADRVREALEGFPVTIAHQAQPLGTGHAALQAQFALADFTGPVMILNGDVPLITDDILRYLIEAHRDSRATLSLLTAQLDHPQGYGRVIRNARGQITRIVEEKDASSAQSKVGEINTGFYIVEKAFLFSALQGLRPNNVQKEYYLTDIVDAAVRQKKRIASICVEHASEVLGINTRLELAWAEHFMRRRILNRHMNDGVTILDPDTVWIDDTVEIGRDTVLHPNVRIHGKSRLGEDCVIQAHTRITSCRIGDRVTVRDACVLDSAEVAAGAVIGPFAHLRPETVIGPNARVGNFVELKKTVLGEGSKVNHLSYLGDTTVGSHVNIGAGTITCNYDGQAKHVTVIEDDVFVGSDTQFIAPVRVGKGAVIGAGSTVTEDVPPDALVVARVRQIVKPGWAARKRQKPRPKNDQG